MVEGDKSEKGTYYYYRIGRQSGSNGELYEATFYYLYFPSERSSIAPRTFLVRPTASPTRSPTRPPEQTIYNPTADELASPLGNYRIDYAQTVTIDSGYYYVEGSDSRYGSYWFHYDEENAKQLDASTSLLPWLYNFKYESKSTSKTLYTYYAPLGRSKSASGLYHNADTTLSEKGFYYVKDGSTTVEEGSYYYYRIGGKDGGWGGYYSEATFYYRYFPTTRTTSRMPGYGRV